MTGSDTHANAHILINRPVHIQTVMTRSAAGRPPEHTELCFESETALAEPPRSPDVSSTALCCCSKLLVSQRTEKKTMHFQVVKVIEQVYEPHACNNVLFCGESNLISEHGTTIFFFHLS